MLIILIVTGCDNSDITGDVVLRNHITTCKDVKVPFTVIEEYEVPLKYQVTEAYTEGGLTNFDYYTRGWVSVKNVDTETGAFSVTMIFETLDDGRKEFETDRRYIMPGDTVNFAQVYDTDLGEDVNFKYIVNPGTKTKTRTVTKYKTEERCE